MLRSGQLGVFEAIAVGPPMSPLPSTRSLTLLVNFVKVKSKAFNIQHSDEEQKSVLAEQKRISRLLLPFVSSPIPGHTYSGVFFTGDRPSWIVTTDKGGARIFPSGHNVVHAFTTCSLWESKADFLLYSEEVSSYMLLSHGQLIQRSRRVPVWSSGYLMSFWMRTSQHAQSLAHGHTHTSSSIPLPR